LTVVALVQRAVPVQVRLQAVVLAPVSSSLSVLQFFAKKKRCRCCHKANLMHSVPPANVWLFSQVSLPASPL
jgi:hypothetical protein